MATLPMTGPSGPRPPRLPQLPGYEVQRLLGEGGMGIVVLARQQQLGRLVAIKLPLQTLSEEGRARFLREARAAAGLRHPNICPVHEVGKHQDQPYLVMDYIDGPTLHDWVGQNPAARRCAELVALLARAVAHAHAHSVIHRDLKPNNILVERATGQPVLTDFGLAKLLDEAGDQLSQSGTVQGTPAYMAPEQAAGKSSQIGPHSDIYSLGAILYELLTNRPPYQGSVGEVLKLVQTEDPAPPRRINPRIHPDLETVCLTAMARDPGQRYPSALALAEDLERFAAGETIRARRSGIFRRTARWVGRHPIPVASGSVGLLAVLVAVVLILAFVLQVRQQHELEDLRTAFDDGLEHPEATEAYFERMEGYLAGLERLSPKQVPELRERMVQRVAGSIRSSLEQPRLSPEAAEQVQSALAPLAARAPEAAAALEQLLRERQGGWQLLFDLRPPYQEWREVFHDSLKPRSDRLERTGGGRGTLVRTRAVCRGPVRLEAVFDASWGKASQLGLVLNNVEAPTGEVLRLAVSSDARFVAAACGATGSPCTSVCDLTSGSVAHTLEAPQPNYAVAFAPGGQRLATAGSNGSLRLWDVATGREVASVAAHPGVVRGLAFAPDGRTLASVGEDGSIRLWEVAADGDALRHRATIARAHGGQAVNDIAFAPDGRSFASAGDDSMIRIWETATNKVVRTLKGHAGRINRIAFNPGPGGPLLASAGEDGMVRLWPSGSDRELAALSGEAGYVYDAAFAPDGKSLAVAYAGKCVKIWDTVSHRVRLELTHFADQVLAVAFTPDGKSVVTGDMARTVRRCDAFTGRELWSLEASAGYAFVLRSAQTERAGDVERPSVPLAEALARGQPLRMQILRNGRLQRERTVLLAPDTPLHLRVSREGDRLTFHAGDAEVLEFQDVFPLGTLHPGVFALEWPVNVGLRQVRAERRALPARPSLLEQGDEAYARGDFAAAADCYARQADKATAENARELRYKRALCLLALRRPEEARPLLGQLARGVTEDNRDRWGLLAACELWLHHLRQREFDQAEDVFRLLETHYRFEQLAALISDELRSQILDAYRSGNAGRLIIRQDERDARHLRRVLDVETLFKASWDERVRTAHFLWMRYLLNGETDQAVRTAENLVRDPALPGEWLTTPVADLVWALRQRREDRRAREELDRRLGTAEDRQCPLALLPLLLERARLKATQKEWGPAEKDVAAFMRQLDPAQWRSGTMMLARAHLVRGFLRDQQGDAGGAEEAWRQGLRALKGTTAYASSEGFILVSLANDLTEADVAFFIEYTTRNLGIPAASLIRKGNFDLRWLASVMRNAWRNPHGREYARRIAFEDLSYMDYHGIQYALFIAEAFRQGALSGPASAEQEALIWEMSESVYRAYTRGEFNDAQAFLGLTAWLGTTGFTGWGGLSASLQSRPQLRGPLAYLYGQRYLRLQKTADARLLFQTALKDARPGTALERLAQKALEQAPAGK
jgi:WD40 repeat protein/tRNA A-37 threonylcarbamoyl transferase component Bud32